MSINTEIDDVFRDNVIKGDIHSGANLPDKPEIRRLLKKIAGGTEAVGEYRGEWDSEAEYIKSDFVRQNGSLWLALRPNSGVTPVEGDDWTLLMPAVSVPDGSIGLVQLAAAAIADFRLVDPNGPRSIIGYYGPYSVQIVGERSFAMGGFRARGRYKRGRAPVFPAPAFTSAERHIISAGNGTSTQDDLGVETLHAKNTWYAVFACANDSDVAAVFKVMPYFRARAVNTGTGQVTLNQSGENQRSDGTRSHTMPTNGLAGVDCLVINETLNGRNGAFSFRMTTVTANGGNSVILADAGTMTQYDYFLCAPPGYEHYRYLGTFYMDTEEVRNIADTGTLVHTRGSNNTDVNISGLIGAGGITCYCDGHISPLATGVFLNESNSISTSEVGTGYSQWGMDSVHDSVQWSWHKIASAPQAAEFPVGLVPFSFFPVVNFRSAGALNTANNNRNMRMRGWIEP